MKKGKGSNIFIFLCLAPAVVLFFIFMIIPTINVFRMSLFRWGSFSNIKEFVGLNNFKTLFNDMNFYKSSQNTILLITIVTIITFFTAIIFAAILTREKIKGSNFFRVVFYIPNILSVVVIGAIFNQIYAPTDGLINSIIGFINPSANQILFLGNQKIVIYALAGAMIWQAVGYYMVMYMSSMASIPESLYESSSLEGAGRVSQFANITLPLIWQNIRTTLTFFIISSINMSFLFVEAMTNGKPDGASEVFLSYMYKQAYTNSTYGYGMAVGVLIFLFSFALSALVNQVTKREIIEY